MRARVGRRRGRSVARRGCRLSPAGAAGAKGDAGPQGPKGEKGDKGDTPKIDALEIDLGKVLGRYSCANVSTNPAVLKFGNCKKV